MLQDISKIINNEFELFNKNLKSLISSKNEEFTTVLDYIHSQKSKQIRPLIGIILAKLLGSYNENQDKFLQGIELIHNATLFHDDVIDDADIRRNMPTLNKQFSNKIAILTGDYFLSLAIKNIAFIANDKIHTLLGDYMQNICEGEIEQNYSLNKMISIDKYIEKSRKKTALLFRLTAEGIAILSQNSDNKLTDTLADFGENFGIAFQINDDINNFKEIDNKPVYNDLQDGIITAPIIYLSQEYPEVKKLLNEKNYSKIIQLLKSSTAMSKSIALKNEYIALARNSAEKTPDNEYKNAILKLLSKF